MSKIDSLKTSFDTKTFVFEILASFLLILFVLLSYYSFFKSKKNKNLYLFSIILTFSFFLTIFLTLGIAGFAANRPINTFLLPQLVISDAFILGIQKDFQGAILSKGIAYLLTAQLLGVLLAILVFYALFKALEKMQTTEEDRKFSFQEFLFIKEEKILVFTFKELFFITTMTLGLITIPRISGAANFTFFNILIIEIIFIFFLLLLSARFGFFTFTFFKYWLDLVIFSIISWKNKTLVQNKSLIINVLIQNTFRTLISVVAPIVISLILLSISASSNLTFKFT
ncbi:MAG4940 family membrane protein [Mesomycoplasma hyorhinis]|uniref:MAG4940 family membrane protein n=1 Tax=Mesomycoplasma hyorhinis TaxID=2100 RepID=UPI001C0572BD|nr:hypothetical protein [Mesomycoplasma hyorhinis]UVT34313.1 hypothetical protein NV230_03725 [Mesomycoplasma hyorhinis]